MALEGLNTNGAFPVYDTSGTVNLYAKQIQQQQAKRAAEQKQIQDQLSKVKVDGLRDADKPVFFEKYDNLKSTYSEVLNQKDPRKKMEAQAKLDQQFLELADLGDRSRTYGKLRVGVNTKALDNDFLDQFDENGWKAWKDSENKSVLDPSIVLDPSTIARRVDLAKVMAELDKDDSAVLASSQWENPKETPHSQGNRQGVLISQRRPINQAEQANRYFLKYQARPEFRVALKQLYPDLAASVPPEQFAEAAINQLVKDRPKAETKAPEFKANDNWKEKANYMNGLIVGRERSKSQEPTYVQDLYNRVLSEEDGAAQELFDEIRGGVMNRGGVLFRGKPSMRKDKDGNVVFTIPEVVGEPNDEGEKKVIKGALTFKYNPNNPEEAVRTLNNMRNSYVTTDKQTLSKVLTPSGKGKVPGGKGEEGFKNKASEQDQAALNWLRANPNAPQAKAVRASLKSKGLIK